jgi:hypothetical protein
MERIQINDSIDSDHTVNFSEEVLEARKIIRQSRILVIEEKPLQCLGGEDTLINPEFKNFSTNVREIGKDS